MSSPVQIGFLNYMALLAHKAGPSEPGVSQFRSQLQCRWIANLHGSWVQTLCMYNIGVVHVLSISVLSQYTAPIFGVSGILLSQNDNLCRHWRIRFSTQLLVYFQWWLVSNDWQFGNNRHIHSQALMASSSSSFDLLPQDSWDNLPVSPIFIRFLRLSEKLLVPRWCHDVPRQLFFISILVLV